MKLNAGIRINYLYSFTFTAMKCGRNLNQTANKKDIERNGTHEIEVAFHTFLFNDKI